MTTVETIPIRVDFSRLLWRSTTLILSQEVAKVNRKVTKETEMIRKARLLVERAGGCPNRIQGAHQVQDFTKAVPRSVGILIGIFPGCWPLVQY